MTDKPFYADGLTVQRDGVIVANCDASQFLSHDEKLANAAFLAAAATSYHPMVAALREARLTLAAHPHTGLVLDIVNKALDKAEGR